MAIQGREEKIAPTRRGEGGSKKKRGRRGLWLLFLYVSVPGPALCKLGRPGVLLVLPEVLTPVLGPLFYFHGLSLPGLLTTAILGSFPLF